MSESSRPLHGASETRYAQFVDAIDDSDIEFVRALLEQGVDPNLQGPNGKPILHDAVESCEELICRLLIERGADVNAQYFGATALREAASVGSRSICALLLDSGANVNAADSNARTALHYAAAIDSATVCNLLVQRGAITEVKDGAGHTPLALAAADCCRDACAFLISAGADVYSRGKSDITPFHHACSSDALDVCRLLVAAGHDAEYTPEKPEKGYLTPLQCAVRDGADKTVAYLLTECRLDPTQLTRQGVALVDLAQRGSTTASLINSVVNSSATERDVQQALGVAGEPAASRLSISPL